MHKRLVLLGICVAVALGAVALKGVSPAVGAGGGTISGRVVNDLNGDSTAQTDEPGLSGWLVTLQDANNVSTHAETRTDSNGGYHFSNLAPNEYEVYLPCAGQPRVWGATLGEFDNLVATVDSGSTASDVDFPVMPIDAPPSRPRTATISGKVVLDQDRDGDAEASEPGVSGWPLRADPSEMSSVCFPESETNVVTDSNGNFTFSGLIPGHYYIYEDSSQQAPLKTWAQFGPGRQTSVNMGPKWLSGEPVETRAAQTSEAMIGVIPLDGSASVSGSIYADLNKNGSRDADEPTAKAGCWMGIGYRIGDAYVGIDPLLLANCDPDGLYRFSGLAPGSYVVGSLFQFSSAINPPEEGPGMSWNEITLSAGQQLTGVDFGYESVPAGLTEAPTVEPSPTPQPTLEPPLPLATTSSTSPATGGASGRAGQVGPPNTGAGPAQGAGSRQLPDALAAAFAVLGFGALAVAAGRRIDVRTRR